MRRVASSLSVRALRVAGSVGRCPQLYCMEKGKKTYTVDAETARVETQDMHDLMDHGVRVASDVLLYAQVREGTQICGTEDDQPESLCNTLLSLTPGS